MKQSRITLYDFVPYGAPELLEVERPYLTRAVATASSGLLALFAIALCASTWITAHPGERTITISPGVILLPPPSMSPPPPALPDVPQPHIARPSGVPVPVREETAPPDALIPSQDELRAGPASEAPANPGGAVLLPVVEAPPAPDAYVYYDEPPVAVSRVVPAYPDLAREAGVDGVVMLRVLVGLDGRVRDVRVDRGVPMLDEAAVAAARQWVFTPALSSGRPVMVWVAIPIRFSLH